MTLYYLRIRRYTTDIMINEQQKIIKKRIQAITGMKNISVRLVKVAYQTRYEFLVQTSEQFHDYKNEIEKAFEVALTSTYSFSVPYYPNQIEFY